MPGRPSSKRSSYLLEEALSSLLSKSGSLDASPKADRRAIALVSVVVLECSKGLEDLIESETVSPLQWAQR